MKQVAYVHGDTPEQFESAFNETCANLSRFDITEMKTVSETAVFIFYDTNEEPTMTPSQPAGPEANYTVEFEQDNENTKTIRIDLKLSNKTDRRCCECDNYDWGKGCPYRDGVVRLMDDACCMFNVIIEGRF